jgi:hypothetical protein
MPSNNKPTEITLIVRDNRPTAIASSAHGAKLDAMAFNISYIASHAPNLLEGLMYLYDQARKLDPDMATYLANKTSKHS